MKYMLLLLLNTKSCSPQTAHILELLKEICEQQTSWRYMGLIKPEILGNRRNCRGNREFEKLWGQIVSTQMSQGI